MDHEMWRVRLTGLGHLQRVADPGGRALLAVTRIGVIGGSLPVRGRWQVLVCSPVASPCPPCSGGFCGFCGFAPRSILPTRPPARPARPACQTVYALPVGDT